MKLQRSSNGYSLIEVMIAMTLGGVVLAGILTVFSENKQTYRVLDARSRMQENARYALYVLGRDLRMSGYMLCGSNADIANTVDSSAWYVWGGAISGYEGGVDTFPSEFSSVVAAAPSAPVDPDAVIIRRADSDNMMTVSSHNENSATVHFAEDKPVEKGEIYVIANPSCDQIGIFQASGPASAGPHNHVVHNTGNATSPGNCTKQMGGNFNCDPTDSHNSCPPTNDGESCKYPYPPGSKIFKLLVRAYYIGSSQGVPSLFVEKLIEASNDADTEQELVVQGIENLQILYGIDTDNDGAANQYVKANAIAGEVVSVRIDLLVRSIDKVVTTAQTYIYQGTRVTTTDRYLRKEFSTTIKLRNLGLS